MPYGYVPIPVDRLGRPLAGWWARFLGIILDFIILQVPKSIVTAIVVGSSAGDGVLSSHLGASYLIVGILFAVVDLGYFAILNGSNRGQTVGQMALGIAVRDADTGGAIDPQRAGLRILVLDPGIVLAWLPLLGVLAGLYGLVAALSPLWDSRKQGFHDKVAHTQVVKVR